VDEPKGAIFGGVVAGPIFREIAGQSMRVLGYYPQKEEPKDKNAPVLAGMVPLPAKDRAAAPAPGPVHFTPPKLEIPPGPLKVMPDLKGYTMRQVLTLLHKSGMGCRLEGSGLAVDQEPAPGTEISPGGTCRVVFKSDS
jgi:cell division protein FtsI (penicillin-binding protein 3)